jgi:hypothetical protein
MKNSMINIAIASCFALSTTIAQADSQISQRQDGNITNDTTPGGTWMGKPVSSGETGTSQTRGSTSSGSNNPGFNNSGSSSSGGSQFGGTSGTPGNSSNSGILSSGTGGLGQQDQVVAPGGGSGGGSGGGR